MAALRRAANRLGNEARIHMRLTLAPKKSCKLGQAMAAQRVVCVLHKLELLWVTLQLTVLLQKEIWNRGGADGAADAEHANASVPLHVMFLTARSEFFDSSGVVPAVWLAEEHINNRSDLLPGYQLHISSVGDSQVRDRQLYICNYYAIMIREWCSVKISLKGANQIRL